MFRIISSAITLTDRLLINLIPLKEDIILKDTGFQRFIVGVGDLINDSITVVDSFFAASTNKQIKVQNLKKQAKGMIIEMPGYSFTEQTIVTINPEVAGSLSYIDGCSNSNIIPPPRNGEPCLNYLYFPCNINQTFHTHPSIRIGCILSGQGMAETSVGMFELKVGDVFILDRFTRHRFITLDKHMSLIAFHPDSDDGPTDEINPMKSRTHL